ncbi:dihydrofolate reductase family protein [Herbiconiux sp. L3-i23]|uniref:dihydrofolate reductase family protein n=1 Tax=Herbiconiux sp. L3-i23 TaxID=2905871 RepID=UPI0020543C9B|nr:dihydrofolate reductase family protein [Herbiconiux sp. L3-i23]BDI24109.1 hypothetical protein L3i23_28850 [Herbiconiux sp. L3-i23]
MRKLIVSVLTSLDGYYEGPDKRLDGMPFEDAFNDHNLRLLREADTLVYGSTWFRDNWEHWSDVAADPSQGERDRDIAAQVLSKEILIISDSMTIDPDAPWASAAAVVARADAVAEITRRKQGGGGTLLMFGSSTTWNPLLEAGVVDELIVLVGAALLGDGSKVYDGARAPLHLLGADVLDGSQLVALRYGVGDRQE